jgi:hypothetical protein
MQVSKALIKKDVIIDDVFKILNLKDCERELKLLELSKSIKSGDLIRISDYINVSTETIIKIIKDLTITYGEIMVPASMSLALLIYGLNFNKRDEYMRTNKDWELVKKGISAISYDKYYDYENRTYEINIKTLKRINDDNNYMRLCKNDFIHLQIWVLAYIIGNLKDRKIEIREIREGSNLVGIRIKAKLKDVEDILIESEKKYRNIVKLLAGWFIYD